MDLKIFQKKFKVSLFSMMVFAFFLLVAMISLYVVRDKILENSHIMGRELAAHFAVKETARLKGQEMLLRSAAQSMARMQQMKPDMSDGELESALLHFTEYMQRNAEVARFDMCAVINGRLVGGRSSEQKVDVHSLRWYQAALQNNNE